MRVAIMQPYFFPYIGYFMLIKNTDLFVLFDNIQYIRHGWINRNRILKPGEGWQYINFPIRKHSRGTLIQDIIINNDQHWKRKIMAQIQHYKATAPHYEAVMKFLENALEINTESVVDLNTFLLSEVCRYLEIDFHFQKSSELNIDWNNVNAPDEWALEISKYYKAKEYINPVGGIDIFEKDKFEKEGISIKFIAPVFRRYSQGRSDFIPSLSIIDVMMFNSKNTTRQMMDSYEYRT